MSDLVPGTCATTEEYWYWKTGRHGVLRPVVTVSEHYCLDGDDDGCERMRACGRCPYSDDAYAKIVRKRTNARNIAASSHVRHLKAQALRLYAQHLDRDGSLGDRLSAVLALTPDDGLDHVLETWQAFDVAIDARIGTQMVRA